MNKILSKTKELANKLGFTVFAKNCKRTSTKDEIFGYILLMSNYMMSHNACTEEMRDKISNGLKLLVFQLNITAGTNYRLAA